MSVKNKPIFGKYVFIFSEGGLDDSLATYSLVAGVWSCMYSLGEVIGPFLGGIFLQHFGFPVATTIMAGVTFSLAVVTTIFFVMKERNQDDYEEISDSGITSATSASWYSNSSSSSQDELNFEHQPLLYDRDEHRSYTVEKVIYYEQSRRQDQEVSKLKFMYFSRFFLVVVENCRQSNFAV